MKMSIHLTFTRNLWCWSIIADGVAFQGSSEGFATSTEAQQRGREALARYRGLMASLGGF
jgi:hypothetical protein